MLRHFAKCRRLWINLIRGELIVFGVVGNDVIRDGIFWEGGEFTKKLIKESLVRMMFLVFRFNTLI